MSLSESLHVATVLLSIRKTSMTFVASHKMSIKTIVYCSIASASRMSCLLVVVLAHERKLRTTRTYSIISIFAFVKQNLYLISTFVANLSVVSKIARKFESRNTKLARVLLERPKDYNLASRYLVTVLRNHKAH